MIRFSHFFICLFFSLVATGQEYPVVEIPAALLTNANQVVRFEEKILTGKSLEEGKLYYKKVVTILNEQSNAKDFVIHYNQSSKVGNIEARLYDQQGKLIRKIDKDEINDYSAVSSFSIYEDDRYKYLEVNHSSYPYTIEVEYEMKLKGMHYIIFPDWYIQQYHTSVEQARFVLDLPEEQAFYYQTLNIDITPKIAKEKGRHVYTWSVKNLPAIKPEAYGPPASEVLPIIKITPDQFEIENYTGSMRSWEDYGIFVHTLYDGRDQLPKDMVKQINKLTAAATTNKEKIDILYRFMQKNMRYVSVQLGIGGWQPFDAEYVSERKYGDCKALTNFMKAMLKEVGITAYPALIETGDRSYELSDTFATPSFNHVILNVPSENYWLECTSSSLPPNYISSNNENRKVLLITEEGGKVIQTPILSSKENATTNNVRITLNEAGGATLNNTVHLKGAPHERYRYYHYNYDLEKQKKRLLQQGDFPTSTIQHFAIKPFEDNPACAIEYELNIPRYGSKAGRRFFIPVNLVSAHTNVPGPAEERRHPIVIKQSFSEKDTIAFDIPDGYEIESIQKESAQLSNSFARYELEIKKQPKGFTLTRQLEVEATRLPPEQYEDFRSFFKEVAKLDGTQVVLVRKKT